jgi:ribosomal protein S18 acetylase RimI-like enzyme
MPYLPELYSQEQIENWIASEVIPNQEVWVAAADDAILGFMALKVEMLNHLYIDPGYQPRGIGDRLMTIAKEQSDVLRLYVFQKNTSARAFYEKRGFRLVRLGDGSGNEENEPDALYEWFITR